MKHTTKFICIIRHQNELPIGKYRFTKVKINSDYSLTKDGDTIEGFITACKLAEKAGVDMIQVSGREWIDGKMKSNTPFFLQQASKLADIVKVPVVLVGGLRDIDTMEDIINKTQIEYLSIARPLICEPDIVKKWKRGEKKKSICLNCNNCLKKGFCVLRDKDTKK